MIAIMLMVIGLLVVATNPSIHVTAFLSTKHILLIATTVIPIVITSAILMPCVRQESSLSVIFLLLVIGKICLSATAAITTKNSFYWGSTGGDCFIAGALCYYYLNKGNKGC